jgi:choline dehydrogenase-like flavoprotein/diketogulonate reductase-like aldo/keto reductase
MLYDFDTPGGPVPAPSDVCVIGAGAAGILLATQLAASGKQVTLLEGGGRQQESASQELYGSEVTGLPHQGIHAGRFRTYGGTTTRWGGQILELDEVDFAPREYVEGSGWPFPKSTLANYYERALRFEGLRRVERSDARVWDSLGLTPPDLGPEFSMLYSRWCPERNFAELHVRALTDSRRIAVFLHAGAVGFDLNEAGTAIEAVRIRNHAGRAAKVMAQNFVLCLGGIETTRLLLQPMQAGTAPWHENGVLGRFYQDHIGLNGISIHNLATQPAQRYFGFVMAKGFQYNSKIQLSHALQASHQALNVAGSIFIAEDKGRDRASNLLRALGRERKVPTAAAAFDAMKHMPSLVKQRISRALYGEDPEWKHTILTVHCEQSPHSDSTITLADERDAVGMLRTRLDWKISDREIASLRTYVKIAAQTFAAKGFARLRIPERFFEDNTLVRSMCGDSNHHMATTRMAVSASQGIVDADLKLHGVANGYVCSSSVFPCSGYSNPTHTVLALGMRLADRLAGADAVVRVAPMASMREVKVAGSLKPVPQLGFGCAYLLGPGLDRTASRRLLDAAWDAGIRHFDTARLYGQGMTEGLLGEFLAEHPEASVATKYGVTPPNTARRVVEGVQRRVPSLERRTRWLKRNDKAKFTSADARISLERSLRELQRDRIELFLLHEPTLEDLVHDDLLEFLEAQRAAGKIGEFGIGGEYSRMEALANSRPGYARVLQFEQSVLGPSLRLDTPADHRVHYRTFAKAAVALSRRLAGDPEIAVRWAATVGADLAEPLILSRLLLKASLDVWPESLTLFSTRKEEHIFDNVAVASDETIAAPARRLNLLIKEEAADFERELYS